MPERTQSEPSSAKYDASFVSKPVLAIRNYHAIDQKIMSGAISESDKERRIKYSVEHLDQASP
jgi:hypothetical protein